MLIDYNDFDQLAIEFEKRRVYGDPRDFDIFDDKEGKEGNNCIVSKFAPYTYPDLIDDLPNKKALSVDSIKSAFREFIRFKVSHAPEATIYERIDVNKHTFHDPQNSILVSLQSYQRMMEGRKYEYFGQENVYQTDPILAELLKISKQKDDIVKQMNDGKISREKALKKANPLQIKISQIETQFITTHIEANIGKINNTLTDNEIPQIPIKLHIVPPDDHRKYGVLVTSGMSAYPMMAPSMAEPTCAELFMLLSPDWPLPLKSVKKDKYYWVIDKLFRLVKYVHGNRQWFSIGHTFGNGHPPVPFANNTKLCAFLFKFPYKELSPTFCELLIGRKPVYFLQVMPIYREEMDFLMGNGPDEFATRFMKESAPEYVELDRVNICIGNKYDKGSKGTFCRKCNTVVRYIDPKKKKIVCPKCGESIDVT
ncbi:MAG: suppressor of fused domain protein [Candidatus Hermodarchaeota archaeon]